MAGAALKARLESQEFVSAASEGASHAHDLGGEIGRWKKSVEDIGRHAEQARREGGKNQTRKG